MSNTSFSSLEEFFVFVSHAEHIELSRAEGWDYYYHTTTGEIAHMNEYYYHVCNLKRKNIRIRMYVHKNIEHCPTFEGFQSLASEIYDYITQGRESMRIIRNE